MRSVETGAKGVWVEGRFVCLAGYAKIRLTTKTGGVLAPQSEQEARGNIDVLLEAAGWHVCDASAANIHAARGVAIREFPLPGYGFAYDPNQLDRDVVTPDQIRTIVRTFRDKLFSEIFPGRTEVPKTLIFAKDDNHAENIVEIVREEFGKGNEFAQKIT